MAANVLLILRFRVLLRLHSHHHEHHGNPWLNSLGSNLWENIKQGHESNHLHADPHPHIDLLLPDEASAVHPREQVRVAARDWVYWVLCHGQLQHLSNTLDICYFVGQKDINHCLLQFCDGGWKYSGWHFPVYHWWECNIRYILCYIDSNSVFFVFFVMSILLVIL